MQPSAESGKPNRKTLGHATASQVELALRQQAAGRVTENKSKLAEKSCAQAFALRKVLSFTIMLRELPCVKWIFLAEGLIVLLDILALARAFFLQTIASAFGCCAS